jgi:hypothetical protein
VRPACGGGGSVVGVGNGGPPAGNGVVGARQRRALACLAFFSFFLCREYLGGARQRAGDAVSLGTAVNPFSLSRVTCCARQRPMPCVAFSYSARQRSLPGKNAVCALCRAPGQNPHAKVVPCARAESARQRLCRAGFGLYRVPVAHGKSVRIW